MVVLFSGCTPTGGEDPAGGVGLAPTGSLAIDVSGLPSGASAVITVSSAQGYQHSLAGSETLSGLPVGTYTIQAAEVLAGADRYAPAPSSQSIVVMAGSSAASAAIAYVIVSGRLQVTISGVPAGAALAVLLTGPGGYSHTIAQSETLAGLIPGSYTIAAGNITSDGYTYTPAQSSQTVVVAAGATASGSVAYAASTGALTVSIGGVPAGTDANVSVSGPGGFFQTLTGTQTLTPLIPGTYSVNGGNVIAGITTYAATPPSQSVTVSGGVSTVAGLSYAAITGALALTVTGVPAGATASLTVTGPGGYVRALSGAQLLSGLAPGSYTIAAGNITSDGYTYTPSQSSQTVVVAAGATASGSVTYAASTGTLSITIGGVPGGTNASVTVTGPGGFTQALTASQTLSGLTPGSYTIMAASVSSGGFTYAPALPSQVNTVTAGATVSTSVSYAASTGVLTVSISGLPGGTNASVTVTGPGGLTQGLTASQTLSGLTPGNYTLSAASVTSGGYIYAPALLSQVLAVLAGSTVSGTVTYVASTGTLTVSIAGLPAGTDANVSVSGPGGFFQALTGTQTLTALVPGTYSVNGGNVIAGITTYAATPPSQSVTVSGGVSTVAGLSYSAITGALALTVTGVPVGANASITVTGPGGYARALSGSQLLSGLAPGSYTISAGNITSDGYTYTPAQSSQTVVVAAGATASGSVTYAASTGTLSVSISGVPGGTNANVSVAGPGGFSQSLTASQTFTGLAPGSYTITAASVTSGVDTYAPTPPSQTKTVTAGATVSASVTYAVSTGALSVTISGLPGGTNANVTVSGPGSFSQNLTASQTLTGLAPGSYAVSATSVTSGSTSYTPAPGSLTQAVNAGATASVSVTYTANAGSSLDLTVNGAYLTQATQRYDGSVPLVAGRNAYLRVFALANQSNTAHPQVRVRLYNGGMLVQTYTLSAFAAGVATAVDEGTLQSSWNVLVPGALVQPGLQLLADVDPANAIAERDETNNAFPLSGTPVPVDVRALPTFALRFVPVLQQANGLQGNVTTGNDESFLGDLKAMLPVGPYDADVRDPYTTTAPALQSGNANGAWNQILSEVLALRSADANSRYYYGVVKVSYSSGAAGLGYVGGSARAAIGWDYLPSGTNVMAHELGHNMSLLHAPCGGAGNPDPSYPYAGGQIGVWGMDVANLVLKSPATADLMGYCHPNWVSDYNWAGMISYRQSGPNNAPAVAAGGSPGLLVWGRISDDGVVLEPAFRVAAAPELAPTDGPYRVELLRTDGSVIRSVRFSAAEVADLPGGSERHFAFVLPVGADADAIGGLRVTAGGRVSVRLAGGLGDPEPVLTRPNPQQIGLRWNAARYPMVLVRDAATGRVLSFARGGSVLLWARGQNFELQFSDGLRTMVRPYRVLQ